MTTNHDDHGDGAFTPENDQLDGLLREWHAENAIRAAAQRDKLLKAVAANAKSRLRGQLETESTGQTRVQSQGRSAHRTLTPTLSLKGEGVRATRFARLTPAIAASLAFAATLGLLFSTAGPQSQARADVIMAPNGGRLDAVNARGELIGPCPLRHTDVHVDVSGSFARVTLQQRYGNPYADKIEAVYTFPLSHRAAVDRMNMTIGDRVVVGEVKEREAARATYEAAKSAGHAAALLEQERPNIFTQSVANIEPGVEIVVEISYVELLEARDGLFGFTFPMVVAPRYIPGGGDAVKPLLPDMVHREGLNLLAPGSLTITSNGDTLNNGVLTADVIHALITDAIPIETPPAEYWPRHYPTTGQPVAWHYFEVGYVDGQREPGVLYTDGLGQINGRWFYVNTSGQTWPPTAAAMPPGTQGTGFASGTSKVPDAARITPQPVMPTTRAGHDISITVNIDTGGPGITDLKSESHAVQQNWGTMRADGSPSQVAVGLNDVATIPNKDFVLHWRQTADTITEQVFTHAGAHGGFITLILNPPARVENSDAVPRELVFVLDTSGSMQGFPIQKAKEVMTKAIAALRPQDTFNLITFAGDTTILWDSPQPATPDKLAEAQAYVESRQGRGGTEMMTAINAALTVKPEQRQIAEGQPTPVRIVCFMTDGEVGNDMAIIDAVKQNAATTRVFSFGIGNSVNRYLLDGIAKAGRGAAEYVLLSEGADEKVAAFTQRIQSPVLMNVKMDFAGDIQVVDRVPEELPDLYDVSPIIVHARYSKGGKGSVTLRGDAGSGPYEKTIELDLPEAKAEHDVIATLWAREKVEQVMNRDLAAAQNGTFPDELKKQVIDLGETFQIMTQYTSFVAVENLRVTVGGQPRLVPVPIELPEGQSWEGTMGEAVNKWADEVAPEGLAFGRIPQLGDIPALGVLYAQHPVADKLKQTTGAINLDGVPFEQAVKQLSDQSGVNITVDWDALETAAIEKDKEVSLRLMPGTVSFETALKLMTEEVGGGEVELGTQVTDGVVQISTKDALTKSTTVQTYNVQDLIERVSRIETNAALDQSAQQEVALEHQLLWEQTEKAYRVNEEKIKQAVIDYDFAQARQLMEFSEKSLDENRQHAADATRYQQFHDHAVQLRRYIDDEEITHDETEIAAAGSEIATRERERVSNLEDSKRKQVDQLMSHAIELRKERRYDDAATVLGQTLAIDPANQRAATMKEALEGVSARVRDSASSSTSDNDPQDGMSEDAMAAILRTTALAPIDVSSTGTDSLVIEASESDVGRIQEVLRELESAKTGSAAGRPIPASSLPKPTVLSKPDEPEAAGGVVDLSRIGFGVAGARCDGFPHNPSSQDSTSPGAEPKPRVFGMIAGQPNQPPPASDGAKTSLWFDARALSAEQASVSGQPPPPQFRGRETVLGQPVTTTAQPAELGEAHAGLPVIRYGLADSLTPAGSTGSFTRSQRVIAAAEGRQAGAVARVPFVGFIAPTPGGTVAPADETLRRSLDLNLGRGVANSTPMPFAQPGLIPTAEPPGELNNVDLYVDADVVSSLSVDTPIAPTTAGVGGAIASNDLNGDGLPDTPTGSSNGAGAKTTNDGWDAGQSKTPVLGDMPALGDEFRIANRRVTLGMQGLHLPESETTSGATRTLKLEAMNPEKAADLIEALQKDQSTSSPASDRVRLKLYLNSKPLDQLAVDLAESEKAYRSPEPTFIDLQKQRTGSNEDSDKTYSLHGIPPVSLEAQCTPKEIKLGDTADYTVTVTNMTTQPYKNVAVNAVLPDGFRLILDTNYKPLKRIGNRIIFALQPMLAPKARIQWTLHVRGVQAGDHRIVASLDYEGWKTEPLMETEAAVVQPGPNDQQALSAEAIAEIERQWDSATLSPATPADSKPDALASIAKVSRSPRPRDKAAEQMLTDQLVVRCAHLARNGRLDSAQAITDAILKFRPDEATAKAMHDVLSNGVLTPQSTASRICELAARPAIRLAAIADRARLMARRLDERLLRLVVGESTIRTHHASGGPGSSTLADKPPVAPQATAGLDVKDGGVLVSVLVDAFGDGTQAVLTKTGLEIESTSKQTRVVIGRIAVKRLADLATCKHVRRVEAVKFR